MSSVRPEHTCTGKTGRLSAYIFVVAFLLLLQGVIASLYGQDSSTSGGKETEDSLSLASVAPRAKQLGFECSYDTLRKQLTCTKGRQNLVLASDVQYYRAGRTIRGLPVAPVEKNGNLKLPYSVVDGCLASVVIYRSTKPAKQATPPVAMQTTSLPATNGLPVSEQADASSGTVEIMPVASNGFPSIQTVVIDPGHGGKDPGAIGPQGTYEKNVVLAVGLALKDELTEKTNLDVYMTRSTDVFVELADRTEFANKKSADLFVSIHANSIGGSKRKREQVKGYKVYFLSHAKSEDDRRVAMLENSVVEFEKKKKSDNFLQNILLDMTANEYLLESQDMSITIAETFASSLASIKHLHTGVGQGPFWVLYGASMPSVLIEIGFISNPKEEKLLVQKKIQENMASAICKAIMVFKEKYELGL